MSDTSTLSVSASGLHQLAVRAQTLGSELSAAAGVSPLAVSSWQANAGVINIACAAARKDLAAMTARMGASAQAFAAAATAYSIQEDASAAALGGLVR